MPRPPTPDPIVVAPSLLRPNDPDPVVDYNAAGRSPFLLVGDHAGDAIPAALAGLGLGAADRARHIALDIGIATLGPMLATALDARYLAQSYSRLVIDCNRNPARSDAIPAISDGTPVPGNADLPLDDRATRVAAIHTPYHTAIAAALASRDAAEQASVLVSLHSFTPVMNGAARPWHIGLLHDGGDLRWNDALMAALRVEHDLIVGDNEPYAMNDQDYTVPCHAIDAGRPYIEIEIRQDLLADTAGCTLWADRLARLLSGLSVAGQAG